MSTPSSEESQNPHAPDLKGVELALMLSIESILKGGLSGSVIEESTTGSLLGSISSNIRWMNHLSKDSKPKCHWTQYRKGGKDLSSEAWTGSDFSLILRIEEHNFRAATFQAKRTKNSDHGFDSVQISPARGNFRPEPQLIRMLRHSANYAPILDIEKVVSEATWLHFLTYGNRSLKHIPISKMKDQCVNIRHFDQRIKKAERSYYEASGGLFTIDEFRVRWGKFSPQVFSPKSAADFAQLLASGTRTRCDESAAGWRTIQGKDAAKAFIEATAPHQPVFEAATGISYSPIITHSDSIHVTEINDLTMDEVLAWIAEQDAENPHAPLEGSRSTPRTKT